jgi:hypothetical protein
LAIAAQKVGNLTISSKQVTRMQEMPSDDGQTYIAAVGGAIKAGEPILLTLTGLPYHSRVPRWTALTLVIAIAVIGVWGATRPIDAGAAQSERKRLVARREKLLQELVRLESDHRRGRVDAARFQPRREELLLALEQVYGALDTDDTGPEPADQRGLAA